MTLFQFVCLITFLALIPMVIAADYTLESTHPYSINDTGTQNFTVPHAIGYKIQFDPQCSTILRDTLSICKNIFCSNGFWGSPYYTGSNDSAVWPDSDYSLYVYSSSFIVQFNVSRTVASSYPWGYKINITPYLAANTTIPLQEMLIIDSPHSYYSSFDTKPISFPSSFGVVGYQVRFDDRSELDLTDFVCIYLPSSRYYAGNPQYSGDNNSITGNWNPSQNITIYETKIEIKLILQAKKASTKWGFKMYIYPIVKNITTPKVILIESPHPYATTYNYDSYSGDQLRSKIAIPTAIGYQIQFEKNQCEINHTGADYLKILTTSSLNFASTPYFAGAANDSIWQYDTPFIVYSTTIYLQLKYVLNSNNQAWGYRVYVTPIYQPPFPPTEKFIVETLHPYYAKLGTANSELLQYYIVLRIPGATGYRIEFDSQTNLSSTCYMNSTNPNGYNCDFININIINPSGVYLIPWQTPWFTDSASEGYWPNNTIVYNPSFEFQLYMYSLKSAWGMRAIIYPIYEQNYQKMPVQSMVQLDSPHTQVPYDYTQEVWIPGATSYKISFDPRTSMNSENLERLVIYDNVIKSTMLACYTGSFTHKNIMKTETQNVCSNITHYGDFTLNLSSFAVSYHANGSSLNGWGYRLYVKTETQAECHLQSVPIKVGNRMTCVCSAGYSNTFVQASIKNRFSFNDGTVCDSITKVTCLYNSVLLEGNQLLLGNILPNYLGYFSNKLYSSSSAVLSYSTGGSDPYTYEMWVALSNVSYQQIFVISATDTGQYSSNFMVGCSNFELGLFYMVQKTSTTSWQFVSPGQLSDVNASVLCVPQANLHLAVVVLPPLINSSIVEIPFSIKLYVNGRSYLELNFSQLQGWLCTKVTLGASSEKSSDIYMRLMVDEFRVYESELSSAEIYNNYQYGPEVISCYPCQPGSYSTGSGNLSCTLCPPNTYSKLPAEMQCRSCPAFSSVAGEGNTVCLCDVGYYMDTSGTKCISCGTGQITPNRGSISSNECINIGLSFAIGLLLQPVILLITGYYLWTGRIYSIANNRKKFCLQFIVNVSLTIVAITDQLRNYFHRKAFVKKYQPHYFRQMLFSWLKIVGMISILVFVAWLYFISGFIRLLFSSVILTRSLKSFPGLSFVQNIDVITSFGRWLSFVDRFYLPIILAPLLQPLVRLIEVISNLQIDITLVGIDCTGSQAPMKLLLNLLILFVIIIIIEADYNIVINYSLSEACTRYLPKIFSKLPAACISFVMSGIIWLFCQLHPLQSLLQYCMTLITITDFVTDNGHHASREACNLAQSMDNMDAFIAICSSVVAYLLFLPALATIARIVYPGMPPPLKEPEEICEPSGNTIYYRYYSTLKIKRGKRSKHPKNSYSRVNGEEHPEEEELFPSRKALLKRMIFSFDLFVMSWFAILLDRMLPLIREKSANATAAREKDEPSILSDDSQQQDLTPLIVQNSREDEENNEKVEKADISAEFELSGSATVAIPLQSIRGEVSRTTALVEAAAVDDPLVEEDLFYELPTLSELFGLLDLYWLMDHGTLFWYTILVFTPLGILICPVCGFYWYSVLWKFVCFFRICFGFWNDASARKYRLSQKMKQFISPRINHKENYYQFQLHSLDCIAALISPRAALLQLIPILTFLTIFAQLLSNSPFTGFTEGCKSYDVIYFSRNPLLFLSRETINRSTGESNTEEENWIYYADCLHNFFVIWRPFKILYNLCCYLIVLAIVLLPNNYWEGYTMEEKKFLHIITIITIFHSVMAAIPYAIKFGKMNDIRDQDFLCKSYQQ